MADFLIRGLDVAVLDIMKRKAKQQNRSLQSEIKNIIVEASERREALSELELIRAIRAGNTKVNKTDSADLLREDRER